MLYRAINEDEKGRLWIGTENGGLSILNTAPAHLITILQDDADNAGLNIIPFCRLQRR